MSEFIGMVGINISQVVYKSVVLRVIYVETQIYFALRKVNEIVPRLDIALHELDLCFIFIEKFFSAV